MKIAAIIIRILAGLMYLFSSVVFFFELIPPPEMSGNIKLFMDGMTASIYLLPIVKSIEFICAIAFISGFYVPLATVVIFPININILMVHVFLAPEGLPVAILLILANLFLAYYYRDRYKAMLKAK